ncbi:hypothetical protein BGZ63DRAFT_24214 [Mariannaea sp. PMI_226]|nr:hypothetical protein BGZ63DRAFT_24214 [Mariannaea sp. PMI_226]
MEERLDQRLDQRLAQHEVRTKLFIDEQLAQKFSEQDSKFARWMTTIQNDLLYLSKSVHQINSRMTRSETRFENDIIKKRKNAARIVDPGTTLLPLYSIHTGTAIPNFPQTCKALCQMDVDALKPILRALELRVDGDLEDLRDRLHLAIM